MVVSPVSTTEPALLSVACLNLNGYNNCPEKMANETNNGKIVDEAFTLPRAVIPNGKDNYAMEFDAVDVIDDKKFAGSNDGFKTDPEVVKKVAAGLKTPNGQKNKTEMSMLGGGGGSLSSGSSIVTISSIANSDPGGDLSGIVGKRRRPEHWYHTTLQVAVPFFIAGIGTIGAGLVLAEVKDWPVFKSVTQLFILVPALLGLKGNLDMCLASRLSTQANLGNMNSCREIMKMIVGNVALVQIQAIVAAIAVSIFALVVGSLTADDGQAFHWQNGMLLAASSVCTATSSCFILDFVMIAVIMVSHRCKMNPDNLATPLAASVGDVVSISVLSQVASALFVHVRTVPWILYAILVGYLLLLPCWVYIVLKNKYTRDVLTSGWVPVLSALLISGFGGLILDQVVDRFHGFVIFQPIINGIGGNLVSVQASRISTMLHQTSIMGILPPYSKMLVAPWTALFKGSPYAKTARILISMAIPGELIFIFLADFIKNRSSTLDIYFVASYIIMAVIQVMLLLYVAHIIIHAMWRYKIDPDNSAIPYLTALGDLTGTLFLALAFWLLISFNKGYTGK